jgi:hypothetical protein
MPIFLGLWKWAPVSNQFSIGALEATFLMFKNHHSFFQTDADQALPDSKVIKMPKFATSLYHSFGAISESLYLS